jgi:hypothetical protein
MKQILNLILKLVVMCGGEKEGRGAGGGGGGGGEGREGRN